MLPVCRYAGVEVVEGGSQKVKYAKILWCRDFVSISVSVIVK
jgi:hypothetical protein